MIREASVFLFVPPAPLSMMNKSASTMASPISVPPSISKVDMEPSYAAYVLILDAATFLFVPPAPSSIINRSASTIAAPISVPPSISSLVNDKPPSAIAISSPKTYHLMP